MAISLASGFSIPNQEPVDSRLVMSKAEMLAAKKAKMPPVYLTMCSDDGQLYLYNSNNDVNAETGRFRLAGGGSGIEDIKDLVSNDPDNIITVTGDGQIKVKESDPIAETVIQDLFKEENEGEVQE